MLGDKILADLLYILPTLVVYFYLKYISNKQVNWFGYGIIIIIIRNQRMTHQRLRRTQ